MSGRGTRRRRAARVTHYFGTSETAAGHTPARTYTKPPNHSHHTAPTDTYTLTLPAAHDETAAPQDRLIGVSSRAPAKLGEMDVAVREWEEVMATEGWVRLGASNALLRELMGAVTSPNKRPRDDDDDGEGADRVKRMRVSELRKELSDNKAAVLGLQNEIPQRVVSSQRLPPYLPPGHGSAAAEPLTQYEPSGHGLASPAWPYSPSSPRSCDARLRAVAA